MTLASIGKVISPFGLRGEVKVLPLSDFLERCYLLKNVILYFPATGNQQQVTVNNCFIHGQQWVMHFSGYDSREKALQLKGSLVQIPIEERIQLPEDHFYFDEIIGLKVITTEGYFLGKVTDILQTGSNDVYVVHSEKHRKDILLPALKRVVLKVDLEKECITVKLPKGLLEFYEVSI